DAGGAAPPDRELLAGREAVEERGRLDDCEDAAAGLDGPGLDAPALGHGDELHPVSDPEDRDPEPQNLRIERGRPIARGRSPTREYDAARRPRPDPVGRDSGGVDLAVDALFPDPSRDLLRVRRPVIENQNSALHHSSVPAGHRRFPTLPDPGVRSRPEPGPRMSLGGG